ncbi:hypothetical protein [Marinoscillum sp. MHG1-6]|uniref:hypothetical protein n=1 Tax=Marinoscillum sp. MHG1-6 TaxID=2959627 RepID=UPI00215820C3|nr:hypothetical protein [Marinoscillum sp. MHG1-6]
MKKLWFIKTPFLILLAISVVTVAVMYLWNWLMPEIFGLTTITFWQAFGLLLLSKIIFGFGKCRGGHHHHPGGWQSRWQKKWRQMSDEDREKWKQKFANKWCPNGGHHDMQYDPKPKE